MTFIKLLKRFISPYKGKVVLNVLFNLLSTILSIFSFAVIVPVLRILFGIAPTTDTYLSFADAASFEQLLDVAKHNAYYILSEQIAAGGAGWVLFILGVVLVFMTGLKCLFAYLASFYMIPIRTGVLRDLRQMLYNKVVALPISYFTETKKGDVMSRMTSDVNEVEASIMASLDMIFRDPIMIILYLVALFCMSWQLTIFVLILLPTAGQLIGLIGRSLKRRSTQGQIQTAQLLTQIEETLGGLRVIKAFNAEHKLIHRFAEQNNLTRQTFNKINRKYALAHPVSEFLGTALIAVLLWYGGGLILSDRSTIDAPDFIYYLVIFYSIINPAKDLTKASYSVRKGMASLERIDAILNVKSNITEIDNPLPLNVQPLSSDQTSASPNNSVQHGKHVAQTNDSSQAPDLTPFVEFQDVCFSYLPDQPVLQHINLKVKRGQTIALVGQSGSGKTTLVDLLPRFYDPQQGAICINGVNIRDAKIKELRQLMGNVNQDAILFNDTIWNNITFGVENATEEQVRQAASVANALDFITAMPDGFQTIVGDRGCRLSGGQRQRISIARAILKNPDILILDEATSALDNESEKLVQQALENLMLQRTTFVVAHRLSTIRNADLICVLHQGQIVEQGTHQELMTLGGYYARSIATQLEKQ